MTTEPVLRLEHLSKRFAGAAADVVSDVSFSVAKGELFSLIGSSGCGKTTTLRMIAGLEHPDRGRIVLSGETVFDDTRGLCVPPERRGVGLVFQDYALFPHLTALKNVMFGLSHLPRRERRARALSALDGVGLTAEAERYPDALSGGQQQRVALARALAPGPALLLFDEPFNSLDAGLRSFTRREVRELLVRTGTAGVLVTHDQEEALSIADRVGVLEGGRLLQVGTPEALYRRPTCSFVANFMGATNVFRGDADGCRGHVHHMGELALDRACAGEVLLSLRPEDLSLAAPGADAPAGRILRRQFKGHDITYVVRMGDRELLVQTLSDCPYREGEIVAVRQKNPAVVLIDAPGILNHGANPHRAVPAAERASA